MDLFDFADTIKKRRKELRMTQTKLAELSGISRVRLSNIEAANVSDITFNTMTGILGALDMSLRMGDSNAGRPTLEDLQDQNERDDSPGMGF